MAVVMNRKRKRKQNGKHRQMSNTFHFSFHELSLLDAILLKGGCPGFSLGEFEGVHHQLLVAVDGAMVTENIGLLSRVFDGDSTKMLSCFSVLYDKLWRLSDKEASLLCMQMAAARAKINLVMHRAEISKKGVEAFLEKKSYASVRKEAFVQAGVFTHSFTKQPGRKSPILHFNPDAEPIKWKENNDENTEKK